MNKILEFINGRKTTVAAIAGNILVWVATKEMLDTDTITLLASILTVWSGVAVGHKFKKKQL